MSTARPTPSTILHALRDQRPATDRRLFLLSEEFASVIHVLGRETGQPAEQQSAIASEAQNPETGTNTPERRLAG